MYKWLNITAQKPEDAKVSILGIPFDGGQSLGKGAAKAPAKIRYFGESYMPCATDSWHMLEFQPLVYDFGDVDMRGTWGDAFNRVEEKAYQVMQHGNFNIFIGGDHSVSIPIMKAFGSAHKGEKIGLIFFDAYMELCDCWDGKIWSHANIAKRALEDVFKPEDLMFVGIRAAEPEEMEFVKRNRDIKILSATDVYRKGVVECSKMIHDKFKDYDALYFTIDMGVLDPAYAPGVGTPVFGGLSAREMIEFVKYIVAELPVTDMDIVEVAPPIDANDITSWAAIRIMHEAFSAIDKKVEDKVDAFGFSDEELAQYEAELGEFTEDE